MTIILSPKSLRFYRREANKKQHEVAEIIGVERTTYVGYEKLQELELGMEVATRVAEFLGVTVEKLEKSEEDDKKVEEEGAVKGSITMPREVWHELKMNNETYRVSLDKLIAAVDRTMDNLSKARNSEN